MARHGGHSVKRLVFVGCYAPEKGIDILWDAVLQHHGTHETDMKLWYVGTGPLAKKALSHLRIGHFEFRQPYEFTMLLGDGGIIFVVQSLHEPRGVVVQEFAIISLPLILLRAVDAGDYYLTFNNVILLDKVDTGSLLSTLETVESWTDETPSIFSTNSNGLGVWPSLENWVETTTPQYLAKWWS